MVRNMREKMVKNTKENGMFGSTKKKKANLSKGTT